MAKKNKLWFSGEDAQLAARFTKCLTIRAVRSKIEKNGQKIRKKKVLSEFDVKGEYKWVDILEQMASVERQMRI